MTTPGVPGRPRQPVILPADTRKPVGTHTTLLFKADGGLSPYDLAEICEMITRLGASGMPADRITGLSINDHHLRIELQD